MFFLHAKNVDFVFEFGVVDFREEYRCEGQITRVGVVDVRGVVVVLEGVARCQITRVAN